MHCLRASFWYVIALIGLTLFVVSCSEDTDSIGDERSKPLISLASSTSTVSAIEPSAASTSTTHEPATTTSTTTATTTTQAESTTSSTLQPETAAADQIVLLRFESQVDDVPVGVLESTALAILNDDRGWGRAGFSFVGDPNAKFRVVLGEGAAVDQLCLPLKTYGTVSCQNGAVVALNADRWRSAVDHWTLGVEVYRGYLVNHEVGHLIGQRHPKPRCPVAGRPAGVMEQQTAGLEGCVGNPWPRDWEIALAASRPVVYAPLPAWAPDPVPTNAEQ